jgi:hypothetical protein
VLIERPFDEKLNVGSVAHASCVCCRSIHSVLIYRRFFEAPRLENGVTARAKAARANARLPCARFRHAEDFERIRIVGGCVLVDVRDGENTQSRALERAWVRIAEQESDGEYRLTLSARNAEVEIGRHMDEVRTRELAAVLRRAFR